MVKVKYARFHQPLFTQGAGHLGDVLPSSKKSHPDLEMHLTDRGLEIKVNREHIVVPAAGVAVMVIDDKE